MNVFGTILTPFLALNTNAFVIAAVRFLIGCGQVTSRNYLIEQLAGCSCALYERSHCAVVSVVGKEHSNRYSHDGESDFCYRCVVLDSRIVSA